MSVWFCETEVAKGQFIVYPEFYFGKHKSLHIYKWCIASYIKMRKSSMTFTYFDITCNASFINMKWFMFSEIEIMIHYKLSFRNFCFAKSHRHLFHSASRVPNLASRRLREFEIYYLQVFHHATRIPKFWDASSSRNPHWRMQDSGFVMK